MRRILNIMNRIILSFGYVALIVCAILAIYLTIYGREPKLHRFISDSYDRLEAHNASIEEQVNLKSFGDKVCFFSGDYETARGLLLAAVGTTKNVDDRRAADELVSGGWYTAVRAVSEDKVEIFSSERLGFIWADLPDISISPLCASDLVLSGGEIPSLKQVIIE